MHACVCLCVCSHCDNCVCLYESHARKAVLACLMELAQSCSMHNQNLTPLSKCIILRHDILKHAEHLVRYISNNSVLTVFMCHRGVPCMPSKVLNAYVRSCVKTHICRPSQHMPLAQRLDTKNNSFTYFYKSKLH